MFNENSGLVKIWVRAIQDVNDQRSLDDVPDISNLREVVSQLLNT